MNKQREKVNLYHSAPLTLHFLTVLDSLPQARHCQSGHGSGGLLRRQNGKNLQMEMRKYQRFQKARMSLFKEFKVSRTDYLTPNSIAV